MTELIPAIDIISGRCVRLTRGDYSRKSEYAASPLDVARRLADAGATTLHLVDLDGARASKPANLDVLAAITAATPLKVEWGGGIKSTDSVKAALDAGADRVVCGSVAVASPELMAEWLAEYGGERIALGADAKDGIVCTHGWMRDGGISAADLIAKFVPHGLTQAVCTEISRDGTLAGPHWAFYESLRRAFTSPPLSALKTQCAPDGVIITVSGGVASMDDVREAAERGLPRIIVGKAFYEGRITLDEMKQWWQNA